MQSTLSFLETTEAAALCRLSKQYLEKLRCTGGGPIFVKLGRRVRYRPADIQAWSEANRRTSTSDPGHAHCGD
ncbi:helix-turn-helix domain-containing protein [Rhizobium sp. R693]|uniref:helix-turn-helix transcriptional regulator n=1 Tax=Rhizobium sp. R693 TaxID=1764276 RepID=UPI000B52BB60|nr:helix-turn-helix domain-containing protein [Rhizobium sp. R693]OWV82708.1 hypothetical protein ATY79_15035 [Rhizobium sp. R693]